ncbi:hypothetical protein [Streptomyces sp. BH104]|uniref:hypothetical protein n=1 Tax=unclassified Streptomyces TaxID=2593676 RepID=UPI003BB4C4E0
MGHRGRRRTLFEPNALVGMEVPRTVRSIWAQRTRWSRGQCEAHLRWVWRPGHWPLWPIAAEALLSYVWVVMLLVATVYGVVHVIPHPEAVVRLPAAADLPPGVLDDQRAGRDRRPVPGGWSAAHAPGRYLRSTWPFRSSG